MKKHRVGIVGYGWAAGAHIAALNEVPDVEVAAVCSSRRLDPGELSLRHGGRISSHVDLEAMLADPSIDTVSITSYPKEHARQAILAARAGKHVIVEKPLALSLEDCRAIRDAVRAAGVRSCVCFECRFSSQLVATKSVIDRGLLGRVHYAEVDYYHGAGPWYGQYRWNVRKDGGGSSLLSAGCHALDGLLHVMGPDVASVMAYDTGSENEHFRRYEYPTTEVAILRFRDGRVGKVASVIDCLQPYTFHVHLVGSEGSLLDDKFHSTALAGLDRNRWSRLSMKLLDSGDVADHPYRQQFAAFFESVDKGEEMPFTSLDAAFRTHEVIFAADRSAREGRPVGVDPPEGSFR